MADLVTRLLLNSSQFDNNIRRSTQQVLTFQNIGRSVGSSLAGAFTKIAAPIGLAMSATEGLTKAMRSNQYTSDLFDNNINALTDSVDNFFRSIATGDWGAFNEGLLGSYRNAFNLSTMLDELADKKLSLNFIRAEDLRDIEKWEQIAKDTNNTYEDRISAAQNMQGVVNHLNKRLGETKQLQLDILNKNYANKSGLNFNEDDVKYFVSNTNFSGSLTGEANAAYKEYLRLQKESEKLVKNAVYTRKQEDIAASQVAAHRLHEFKAENEFLIKQGWLTEENDEGRKKTVDTLIEQLNLERESYSLQKRVDETKRSVTPVKVSAKTDVKAGIKEATKEIKLDPIKVPLRFLTKDDLESSINKMVKSDIESGKILIKGVDPKETQANLDYMASLNGIATVMGSVTNMTNEGAAGWLQYSANVINSVAAMLPVLANLFGIESALGVAKQAKLAFPMNVIAMAATTAGLVAALASIPKFATGGVVEGSRTFGDFNLARVNSGEMILNKHQQGNLFSMLNTGSSSLNGGSVKFKIEGKDLVGVLGSYNSKVSKYR